MAASRSADSVFAIQRGGKRDAALGREIDKAARKLDVAGAERRLDLARCDCRIEAPLERKPGEPHRIVLHGDRARRMDALGQADERREREATGDPSDNVMARRVSKSVPSRERASSRDGLRRDGGSAEPWHDPARRAQCASAFALRASADSCRAVARAASVGGPLICALRPRRQHGRGFPVDHHPQRPMTRQIDWAKMSQIRRRR